MNNIKSILLFSLGFLININQGLNMDVGMLSDGTARGVDIIMPLDLPLLALMILYRDGTLKSRHNLFIKTIKISFFVFWLLSLTGELVAVETPEFRIQLVQLTRALFIGYVVMTRLNTYTDLRIFILGLLTFLAFESFVGVWQWQIGPLNLPFMPPSTRHRISGTIGVPNAFAAWLIAIIPLCMRMSIFVKLKPHYLWQGVLVLSLACLLATYTRGAWFSFLLTTPLFAIIDFVKKKVSRIELALFVSMAVLVMLFISIKYGSAIMGRMFDVEKTLAGSMKSSRLYLAEDALRIIKEHKLVGVGLDNYRYHADPEIPGLRIVHNAYLLVAAEQGIGSALLFILLMILVMVKSWRLLDSKISFFYHIGAASLAGIMNLFVYYMVGVDYNLFEVLFQHWRLIGFLPAILVCEQNATRRLLQKTLSTKNYPLNGRKSQPYDLEREIRSI